MEEITTEKRGREEEENCEEPTQKKELIDWAQQYGLSQEDLKPKSDEFEIRVYASEHRINVDIFRPDSKIPRDSRTGRPITEDGFSALELMFSGKIEINRVEGEIYNWNAVVNQISMHHANHFGPERGLVIAKMIETLSQRLIVLSDILWKKRMEK